jgi:hypothetical protein
MTINWASYPPQAPPDPPYRKPAHGQPCNSCGRCCLASPCDLSQKFFGIGETARCPALLWTYAGSRCGLVQEPEHFAPIRTRKYGAQRMKEAAKRILGSGWGCGMRWQDEPANEAFLVTQAHNRRRLHKLRLLDQRLWGI